MNADEMRASRNKAVVAYMKFVQCKDNYSTCLFCFYEGEDIKYYEPRIVNICKIPYDRIISFNCGGKVGVKTVHAKISGNAAYAYVKKMYFIDKDYFPLEIVPDDMFETPCYSIENLYTSIKVFERVLKREFGMNMFESDFIKCRDAYLERQREFHDCILELNAWLKCQRRIDIKKGFRGVQIKTKVAKYFERIDLDGVRIKQPIDKSFIEKEFPDASVVSSEEINEAIEELKISDQQKAFRGKFELEFMVKMITDLRAKVKSGGYLTEEYECVKIDASGNPLTILCIHSDTPDELESFLLKYKGVVSNQCFA